MSSTDFSGALWRKSSYSNGQANCVEVAARGGRTLVAVRDSKAPDSSSLIFTTGAWRQFTDSVKPPRRNLPVEAQHESCRPTLSAADARVRAKRGECIKIRPSRLPDRPWVGIPTARKLSDNRALIRRYARIESRCLRCPPLCIIGCSGSLLTYSSRRW